MGVFLGILSVGSLVPHVFEFSPQKISVETTLDSIDRVVFEKRKSAIPLLLALLDRAERISPDVSLKCLDGLGEMGEEEIVPALVSYLNHEDRKVQSRALNAIARILKRRTEAKKS